MTQARHCTLPKQVDMHLVFAYNRHACCTRLALLSLTLLMFTQCASGRGAETNLDQAAHVIVWKAHGPSACFLHTGLLPLPVPKTEAAMQVQFFNVFRSARKFCSVTTQNVWMRASNKQWQQ